MTVEWYYTSGGEQYGPATAQQLKELAENGRLRPTDQVWNQGIGTWKPAAQVKGLFPDVPTGATPSPPPTPTPDDAPVVNTGTIPRLRSSQSNSPDARSRPLGVILIGVYSAVSALSFLVSYCFLAFLTAAAGEISELGETFAPFGRAETLVIGLLAILALLTAVLMATASYGLFTLQKWSYSLTMIVYGIAGVIALLGLLASRTQLTTIQQVPSIIGAVVVIVYLNQPRVKAHFEKW